MKQAASDAAAAAVVLVAVVTSLSVVGCEWEGEVPRRRLRRPRRRQSCLRALHGADG